MAKIGECFFGNSLGALYRIFKKMKDICWYCPETGLWLKADIIALTGIKTAMCGALSKAMVEFLLDRETCIEYTIVN